MAIRGSQALNRFLCLFLFQFFSTLIPRPIQKYITVVIGDLFYLLMPETRRAIRKNLEVVGRGRWSKKKVEALTRKTFQNYGQYLLDYMVMHRLRPANKDRWIEAEEGDRYMIDALQRGRGAICITPHLGNWEMGGLLFSFKGGKLNVLTLDEPDHGTKSYREEMRRRAGIKNIYIDPKVESPVAILDAVKALKRNEIVAMLGDRVETPKTMTFDFFGRKTPFPIGVALLSLATGAPVLPVFVVLEKNRKYRGVIESPITFEPGSRGDREEGIRRGMETLIKKFEAYIEKYPDQWYNFFSYWPERPSSSPTGEKIDG
ncbi:MAG: lysophospholipid acyltransferase family protein [Desulfobacterota bacterium]|nr:lysophospholipid acyltransferase family protein [Thermodesulfobacteriota bacterium]